MTSELPGIALPECAIGIAKADVFDPLRGVYSQPASQCIAQTEPLPLNDGGILTTSVDDLHRWSLTILGEPVAKGRPKLGTVNGHAMAFTPSRTRRYEDIVRQTAVQAWGRPLLAGVPIQVQVVFCRGIPASWSKRNKQAAMLMMKYPIGRPDLDNCVKSITDGLNGVVYADDAAIWSIIASKRYSTEPRVEVTLTW